MAYGYSYEYDPFNARYSLSFEPIISATPPKPAEPHFKFEIGDKVAVKVDATATVEYVNSSGTLNLRLDDGSVTNRIPAKFATLKAPNNFPPKVGQAWKAGGKVFGVRQYLGSATKVVVYPIDQTGKSYSSDAGTSSLDEFAKLRPQLVG
jgi:hypothetical protein